MASTEHQAMHTEGIEGIALRYGLFYGADPTRSSGCSGSGAARRPTRRRDPLHFAGISMRVSNRRAKDELSWKPKYPSISDGIRAKRTS
jgi:hypothetical protein